MVFLKACGLYRSDAGLTLPARRWGGPLDRHEDPLGSDPVVLTVVLATMWGATQWTAWRLGFQPQLGPPWFELLGAPVYLPPAFFWWWYHYDAYAPRDLHRGRSDRRLRRLCRRSALRSACRCGARGKPRPSRPMVRRAGRPRARFVPPGFSVPMASCSAGSPATIFATTGRSTCCASRRPAPARASASSFRRC